MDSITEIQQSTATSSLQTMKIISDKAGEAKNSHSSGQAVLNENISDDVSPAMKLRNISKIYSEQNRALEKEPFVTRLKYLDENDVERTIYFCRGSNGNFNISKLMLTNVRSKLGHLASLNPGDEYDIHLNEKDRYFRVLEKIEVTPTKIEGEWDSKNSKFYLGETGKFTIPSLRALIGRSVSDISDEELFGEETIFEGFERDVLTSRYLRDQANLDKFQSVIFRLPLNSRCFLHGPPGTGKTTTLIRRLGQKTDILALEDSGEIHLIDKLEDSFEKFGDNWIMFFPTELLKIYVGEAFNKEGIAAPKSRIKTWNSYRKQIGDKLNVLRSNKNQNGLIISDKNSVHLSSDVINRQQTDWFDDFYSFQKLAYWDILKKSCDWLQKREVADIQNIVTAAKSALDQYGSEELGKALNLLTQLEGPIKLAGDIRRRNAEEAVKAHVRIISRTEKGFLQGLQTISDQTQKEISARKQSSEELEQDTEQDDEVQKNNSSRKAPLLLVSAIQAYASARVRKRKLPPNSYNAQIIEWLGADRLPDDETLEKIGQALEERRNLRPLHRCAEKYVRFPKSIYRKFRSSQLMLNKWYLSSPVKNSQVHSSEVDLILLAMFRSNTEVLNFLKSDAASSVKDSGMIGILTSMYKAQVLIDEATDFSAIQLAIMYEMSDPALRSIFLSGDFNQRLTMNGVKNSKELKWAIPDISLHPIAIAYRQTERLKKLSQAIVMLDGGDVVDLASPEGFKDADIRPVLGENLYSIELTSQWLADRIYEIDKLRGSEVRPTIALLVNSDDEARTLATALSEKLAEINIEAVACLDGASIGDDNDVRIYDKKYIKGLEFEAVFFVGIDDLEKQSSDLFLKYLYVGSSRAATFFGMTSKNNLTQRISPLREHFTQSWSEIN